MLDKVPFVKVQSSNIDFVGYLDSALYVGFKGGSVYKYLNADEKLFEAMITSPSIGKFFHANIKNKNSFQRIPISEGTTIKLKLINADGSNEIVEHRLK